MYTEKQEEPCKREEIEKKRKVLGEAWGSGEGGPTCKSNGEETQETAGKWGECDVQQNELFHKGRVSHLCHTELQGQARGGLGTRDGLGNKEVLRDGRCPREANRFPGRIATKPNCSF